MLHPELPERIRAFAAIRLSAAAEDAIEALLDPLRRSDSLVRWVRRANLHVTLRFLGNDATPIQLEALAAELAPIAATMEPFRLDAAGIGGFPNLVRPRVIWIGLQGANLIPLAASVEAAAIKAGFAPADRPYSPHLTIGRLREPQRIGTLRPLLAAARDRNFGTSLIESMALYRSVLGGPAAKYIELAHWQFGTG